MSLSVAIISKNEEQNIKRTLEGIADIADEIILIDSFSTDKTLEIAQQYNCKIFQEEWKGFAEQKNSAFAKCSHDWILSLDCDEEVTPQLKESIQRILKNPDSHIDGYYINWRSVYLGKVMKYSWQPNLKLRLVRKSSNPHWEGEEIHEELRINGETRKIKGELLHYSFPNLKTHFKKTIEYAELSAIKYSNQSRKFHYSSLIFNPFFAFFKMYFIHLGFLDGVRGLLAASSSSVGTFLKYAFLYEKQRT